MVDLQRFSILTFIMVRVNNTPDQAEPVYLSAKGVLRGMKRLGPVAIFVIPFGIGFGVAAIEQGLTLLQTVVMSAVVFSGAAQFASLDFWPGPFSLISMALVMFAINARHIITGAALSPWLNQLPLGARWSALALLSDPNFADSRPAFQSGERDAGILLGGGVVLWLNWVLGTAIGAFAGAKVDNLQAFGFDVVMVCFFATAVTGRLKDKSAIAVAMLASGVAVLTLGWLPVGWNIIAAAVAGGFLGVLLGK